MLGDLGERVGGVAVVEPHAPRSIHLGPLTAEGADDALAEERSERAHQSVSVGRVALLMLSLYVPIEPADPHLVIADRLAELLGGHRDDQLGVRADTLHHR